MKTARVYFLLTALATLILLLPSCALLSPSRKSAPPALESEPARPIAEEPAAPVSYRPRPVARGTQSAVRVPVATTIGNQMELEDVWAAIHANKTPVPQTPQIDFSSELLILVVLGERPSTGYTVSVVSATETSRSVEVALEVTAPDEGALVGATLTSPFEIAAISRSDLPVEFVGDDVAEGFDPL